MLRGRQGLNFIVYTRSGCCLCDQMVEGLEQMELPKDSSIELIDIDADEQLVALYAGRIPVLVLNQRVLCEYFLDQEAVYDAIRP